MLLVSVGENTHVNMCLITIPACAHNTMSGFLN